MEKKKFRLVLSALFCVLHFWLLCIPKPPVDITSDSIKPIVLRMDDNMSGDCGRNNNLKKSKSLDIYVACIEKNVRGVGKDLILGQIDDISTHANVIFDNLDALYAHKPPDESKSTQDVVVCCGQQQ